MSYPKALLNFVADCERAETSFSDYHDRRITPGETFAAIRPFFRDLGITRVGMLTGLDRLNVPVAFATRPNSFTLSVFQGKGIDGEAAMTSAVMEAVETRIAEIMPEDLPRARVEDMLSSGKPVLDLETTARCVPSDIADGDIPWIQGLDLVSRNAIHVPWWLVGMDHRFERPAGFEQSSDGLASGNSAPEAILHGLCELIERDAWALAQLQLEDDLSSRLVDPSSLDDAVVDILCRRIHDAGMSLVLMDMTTDIAVPAFFALLVPRTTDKRPDVRWSQICGGCGCHPDPVRAALRAITEAAQSRLTAIAGSRDDFTPRVYQRLDDTATIGKVADLSKASAKAYREPAVSDRGRTINETIEHIVGRLEACGIRQVVAVPMQSAGLPVSVVRVIVPGLEVDLTGQHIQLGIRAAQVLRRRLH